MLQTIDIQNKASLLFDQYKKLFKVRFGQEPVLDVTESMDHCKWLVSNVGFDRAQFLLGTYFQLNDEWITKQGFGLSWFKNNLNKIICQFGNRGPVLGGSHYVVALTESGVPVVDKNPAVMGPGFSFKPVPWNRWLEWATMNRIGAYKKTEVTSDGVHTMLSADIIETWKASWAGWFREWKAYENE